MSIIRPILEAGGGITRESSQHAAKLLERGMNGHVSADKTADLKGGMEREEETPLEDEPVSGDMPEGESRGSRSSTISLDELRRVFVVQQDVVRNLRQGYDTEIDELRVSEADRLLSFTDSNHEGYEGFITGQMEGGEEELGKEEEELTKLYR